MRTADIGTVVFSGHESLDKFDGRDPHGVYAQRRGTPAMRHSRFRTKAEPSLYGDRAQDADPGGAR